MSLKINYSKQLPAPYIIVADFEALNVKIEGPDNDPNKSNTKKQKVDVSCSFSYLVVRSDGETGDLNLYLGENEFLRRLKQEEEEAKIKVKLQNMVKVK